MVANAWLLAAVMLSTWLASLRLRDASIVDTVWGPAFSAVALSSAVFSAGAPPRRALVAGLALAWGLRLGIYLFRRGRGKPEDFRYQAMRRSWGARFGWVSLFTVFAGQGALVFVISLPLQVAAFSPEPPELGPLDALGAALWAVGMFFECAGDLQLARFRADPANAGRVLDTGLWRYTRHPNYFGDFLVWWGFFAIAAATPGGVYTVVSPILMTILLLRVSGVSLLERALTARKPEYADYVARTPAFIPGPPRSQSSVRH
jgi:steroid 5-alpha reductase family enzyme